MNLESRLRTLEAEIEHHKRWNHVTKRLITIVRKIAKGRKMSAFDFDSLLDEIDEIEKSEKTEPTPEVETPVEPPESDVMTSTTDEEVPDTPVDVPEEPPVQPNLEQVSEPNLEENISEKAQEVIDKLETEIDSLKDTIKGLKIAQSNAVVDTVELPDMEYQAEVKQFLKEFNSLEFDKREIQEKTKVLKDQYKEIGVDVTSAIKAQREIMKELKETAEEAQIIEAYKGLVKNDDALMNDVNILTA